MRTGKIITLLWHFPKVDQIEAVPPGQNDLYHSEILHQAYSSPWIKEPVCTCWGCFSRPLWPSSLLTRWHLSANLLRTFMAKSHWIFWDFPKRLSASYRQKLSSHSALQSTWALTRDKQTFCITESIYLITGLNIENADDCDGTEPSGWIVCSVSFGQIISEIKQHFPTD